jgi:Cu/Ag efflux protein CusF
VPTYRLFFGIVAGLLILAIGGYALLQSGKMPAVSEGVSTEPSSVGGSRKILYWYDPMYPQQRFDKPGRSPFMDMDLVPKYADEEAGGVIKIDAALARALGVQVAPVQAGKLPGTENDATLVPSKAVIQTGQRNAVIVMIAENRFRRVEVEIGQEIGRVTVIQSGLSTGQNVVVSGQFLIDSEASLREVFDSSAVVHQGEGKITDLSVDAVTFMHGPIPSIQWGPMTMSFQFATPGLAKNLQVGDTVSFGFRQTNDGYVVERIEKIGSDK